MTELLAAALLVFSLSLPIVVVIIVAWLVMRQ
jgi:hypothetical protein